MQKKRFKKVYVEITSLCNRNCAFCPPTQRPPAFMENAQFQHIIQEITPLTDHLYLHVKGEPLLHPNLIELLDIANSAKLRVHIVTNGALISTCGTQLLKHPALHKINFSLHSFAPDDNQNTLANYIDPIISFAQNASQQGRIITALRFWNSPDPELLCKIEAAFPDRNTGNLLAPRTYLDFATEFSWPSLQAPIQSTTGFCLGLRDQVAILVDGTVVPCCLDAEAAISLGNIFQQPIHSILASDRAQNIYHGFTENQCVEPLCQRCTFRTRFN